MSFLRDEFVGLKLWTILSENWKQVWLEENVLILKRDFPLEISQIW